MSSILRDKVQQVEIVYLWDLVTKDRMELQEMGFRGEALNELEEVLLKKGLRLGMDVEMSSFSPVLAEPVANLELTVHSHNVLTNGGIEYLGDLVRKKERELLKISRFRKKTLNEIKEVLSEKGFAFGDGYRLAVR